MARGSYPWKRFWCPPEGKYVLDESGYLYDPDSKLGKYVNPDVASGAALPAKQCMFFLGEPGIGKTHEVKTAFEGSEATQRKTGYEVLHFDLSLDDAASAAEPAGVCYASLTWADLRECKGHPLASEFRSRQIATPPLRLCRAAAGGDRDMCGS